MRCRLASKLGRTSLSAAGSWLILAMVGTWIQAQDFDVEDPPGAPQRSERLGPEIGAAEFPDDEDPQAQTGAPLGGPPGPTFGRIPLRDARPPERPLPTPVPLFRLPQDFEPEPVPRYGQLELPPDLDFLGPEEGLSLDIAIEVMLRQNLELIALRYEIPQARADVLTVGLRPNPIIYGDVQQVPYGRYSRAQPGGPTNYNFNVVYPLDLTGKRRARVEVAERALQVTEAQLQDAVRLQVDNLYTAFVDAVAARETQRFSQAFLEGITRVLEVNRELLERGQITPESVLALETQQRQAELQIREADEAYNRTRRILAVLLNLPRAEAPRIEIRGLLRSLDELPMEPDELIGLALTNRPDLNAYRLGLQRSRADLRLAEANRLADSYVLFQPYTFEDNTPYGLRSPHSWALGVTLPVPLFNRNQGNINRARINVTQTEVELALLEREIIEEVDEATREFALSRLGVLQSEQSILPSAREVRDLAYRRWQGGETGVLEYLEAQRSYNEAVQQYRDLLVRHRRSMLELNTAVGRRVLP